MNERSKLLLEMVLSHDNLTQQQAAIFLGVSERTIRKNLDEIDEFLMSNNLKPIEKKTKTLLKLNGKDVNSIRNLLDSNFKNTDYMLNPQNRQNMIFYLIMIGKSRITIEYIEDFCQMSRSTVNSDIKNLKELLGRKHIFLRFNKNEGFFLEGNESAIRETYVDVSASVARQYLKISLMDDIESEFIKFSLNQIEKELHIELTYVSFIRLFDYLSITIKRILQNSFINKRIKIKSAEYSKIMRSVHLIECFFKIKFSENEIEYLIQFINRSHLMKDEIVDKKLNLKLDILAGEFIDEITRRLKVVFLERKKFVNNLTIHLQTVINQKEDPSILSISDSSILELKNKYSLVFKTVSDSVNAIPEMIKLGFQTDENIYLLAVHIISGIEQTKNITEKKLKALIVCHMGIGTSQYLKVKLTKYFHFECKVASIQDIQNTKNLNDEYDLIISTVSLSMNNVKYLRISPYITDYEIKRISNIVNRKVQEVMKQDFYITKKELKIPVLKELLTEEKVQMNVQASDWEDAIRKAGEILVNSRTIDRRYIDGMINVVKEFGSYIVILPGIALAHASSSNGVNEIGMSLITLKEDVEFGNKNNDPVHTVICLATVDQDTHLKALSELVTLLNTKGFNEDLQKNRKQSILNAIKELDDVKQ